MANESEIIELLGIQKGRPIRYNVADGTNIPKGSNMEIKANRTAEIVSGAGNFAGIAASEKVADDGSTTLALYTHGIFNMRVNEAVITAGDHMYANAINTLAPCDATGILKPGRIVALEDSNETLQKIACLVGSGL